MRSPSSINDFFQILDTVEKIWTPISAATRSKIGNYPPYNIIKKPDDGHVIEVGCAGFSKSELFVGQKGNILTVKATPRVAEEPTSDQIIHNGLARRAFDLKLQAPPNTAVASVAFVDGVLTVLLSPIEEEDAQTFEINDSLVPPKKRKPLNG